MYVLLFLNQQINLQYVFVNNQILYSDDVYSLLNISFPYITHLLDLLTLIGVTLLQNDDTTRTQ